MVYYLQAELTTKLSANKQEKQFELLDIDELGSKLCSSAVPTHSKKVVETLSDSYEFIAVVAVKQLEWYCTNHHREMSLCSYFGCEKNSAAKSINYSKPLTKKLLVSKISQP